jgi:hypothetical protein
MIEEKQPMPSGATCFSVDHALISATAKLVVITSSSAQPNADVVKCRMECERAFAAISERSGRRTKVQILG